MAKRAGANATEPGVPGVLLHQWELLDAGVRLLHQHQAHQRPGLRRLLPAVLLESHAGDEFFPTASRVQTHQSTVYGAV